MRRLAGALVAAVLVVLPAAPAAAHNRLESSTPADGATVETAPGQVVLTFDQPAIALGARVVVLDPGGATVSAGEPRFVDSDVTQDLAGDLPAGAYRVEWRVTSADGHPVSGELAFTASGPGQGAVATAPGEPAPAADPASEGASGWALAAVVGGVVVVAVVVVTLLVARARRSVGSRG